MRILSVMRIIRVIRNLRVIRILITVPYWIGNIYLGTNYDSWKRCVVPPLNFVPPEFTESSVIRTNKCTGTVPRVGTYLSRYPGRYLPTLGRYRYGTRHYESSVFVINLHRYW